jgi:hypothetical protein
MAIGWIVIYIAAVVMLFVSGGGIAEQATVNVPLLSSEGFFKINAILFMLTLTAMVFVPGPIFVIDAIADYVQHKQYPNWLDKIIIT